MFYVFQDVSSGGCQKRRYRGVIVEAGSWPQAVERFEAAVGQDPRHITCECCGWDYLDWAEETLEEARESAVYPVLEVLEGSEPEFVLGSLGF